MFCPLTEYACVVWDHAHYQSQVSVLEKVKRHAARWVLSDYSYHSSASSMVEQFNYWLPLAKRRKQQRLKCLSKVKASAYLLMVHPLMEYACVVWDLCMAMHTSYVVSYIYEKNYFA